MTKEQLEEIKARAEAATPGPWDARCKEFSNTEIPRHIWSEYGWLATFNGPRISCMSDTEFIANARTDIPALIAEVERLTEFCREGYGPAGLKYVSKIVDERNQAVSYVARLEARLRKSLGELFNQLGVDNLNLTIDEYLTLTPEEYADIEMAKLK